MKIAVLLRCFSIVLLLLGTHISCQAVDSMSAEFANGNRTKMIRAGVQWDWAKQWTLSKDTLITGYWDLTVARWRSERFRGEVGANQNLIDLGITPVFRFQKNTREGPFLEGGIGAHYLSRLYDNNGHALSTRFQFGSHVGVGYVFSNKMELVLKLQHLSNAGIKKPNDGVDFAVIGITHRF